MTYNTVNKLQQLQQMLATHMAGEATAMRQLRQQGTVTMATPSAA